MSRRLLDNRNEAALERDARLAALGDDHALYRLFEQMGPSAWGLAYAATKSVPLAEDAVAAGFSDAMATIARDGVPEDLALGVLQAIRHSAIAVTATDVFDGPPRHARATGAASRTFDPTATLSLSTLDEPSRVALFLVEGEGFTTARVAQLLGDPPATVEELLHHARCDFRRAYAQHVDRDRLGMTCLTALEHLADHAGKELPGAEAAAVDRHLAECSACRSIVGRLDGLRGRLLDGVPPMPLSLSEYVVHHWCEVNPFQAKPKHVWWVRAKRRPMGLAAASIVAVACAAALVISLGKAGPGPSVAAARSSELQGVAPTPTTPGDGPSQGPTTTTSSTTTVPTPALAAAGPSTTATGLARNLASTSTVLAAPATTVPSPTTTAAPVQPAAPTTTTTVGDRIIDLGPPTSPTTTAPDGGAPGPATQADAQP